MKVNDIDIKTFNAKQLKFDLQPSYAAVNIDNKADTLMPIPMESEEKLSTFTLSILFKGKNKYTIDRNISKFVSCFTKETNLMIDNYKGTLIAYLKTISTTKIKGSKHAIVDITGECVVIDEMEIKFFGNWYPTRFNVSGTKKTPCIITISAYEQPIDTLELIDLMDDKIIIKNIKEWSEIVINGMTGEVTEKLSLEEAENKIKDVEFWELPYLKPGENWLILSNYEVDVNIKYYPRW